MSIIQGDGYQRREHWEHLRSAKRRMTVGSSDHMASHRTKARNAETKINREFKSKVFGLTPQVSRSKLYSKNTLPAYPSSKIKEKNHVPVFLPIRYITTAKNSNSLLA